MPQRFIAIPAALSHLTIKAVYAGEASDQKLFDVGMAMGQRLWPKSLLLGAKAGRADTGSARLNIETLARPCAPREAATT
jgi:hypothetical protein